MVKTFLPREYPFKVVVKKVSVIPNIVNENSRSVGRKINGLQTLQSCLLRYFRMEITKTSKTRSMLNSFHSTSEKLY